MRMTAELKTRIERGLSKKYEAEYKKNEEEYWATVAKEKPAIVTELEKILSTPVGYSLIKKAFYRDSSLTADKVFENCIREFCSDAYKKKNKADIILHEKKRLDYEELAIQIAYQKNIEGIKEAFATMDVYLKKRYDLIPNLVETVKGYAKHESETLENVVKARNLAMNASTTDEKIVGEGKSRL